jgi:serine/threonine protein kinase
MGEVYKATDTRLDRTVAVKILSDRIASSIELRARFEREARDVALLDPPISARCTTSVSKKT